MVIVQTQKGLEESLERREKEITAIAGWDCSRDEGLSEALRDYRHARVNHREYDLTDHDRIASILSDH